MAKRKREEVDDDSEDERPTGQAQILPVATKLPESGEITNGMEYLLTVRRDAFRLPNITSVPNPYAQPEPVPPPRARTSAHALLPSDEWRKQHVRRFNNFRKNLVQPAKAPTIGPQAEPPAATPGNRERVLWWKFLCGEPESVWNPPLSRAAKRRRFFRGEEVDEPEEANTEMVFNEDGELVSATPQNGAVSSDGNTTPREPTPYLLRSFNEDLSVQLLRHFAFWIRGHVKDPAMYDMTELHARWMFSLLARLGQHISADHMNSLRQVARACISLLEARMRTRLHGPEAVAERTVVGKASAFSERSCWVLLGTIIGVWGQLDLWDDVESMLRGLPAT
ncbi:hypothetical protein EV122DRAFT_292688 [Schizophyllum commune]